MNSFQGVLNGLSSQFPRNTIPKKIAKSVVGNSTSTPFRGQPSGWLHAGYWPEMAGQVHPGDISRRIACSPVATSAAIFWRDPCLPTRARIRSDRRPGRDRPPPDSSRDECDKRSSLLVNVCTETESQMLTESRRGGSVALTWTRTIEWDCAEWRTRAACRDTDPDLFFPVGTTGQAVDHIEAAKSVCARCSAQPECLEFALYDEPGVRGVGRSLRGGAPEAAQGLARRAAPGLVDPGDAPPTRRQAPVLSG